jgi:tetratricopeptide (TPR) repeat protein
MTKTCPSCEILAPPEARYCRHCGTQLKRVGALGNDISPIAATMPLSGENTTDEIVAPLAPPSAANTTSEVTHEELHDLLGRGTPAGEMHDAQTGPARDGQPAHARGDAATARAASPNANYAGSQPPPLHDNGAPSGISPDDFDPEQTQITINVRPLTSRNLPADAASATAAAVTTTTRANNKPQFNSAPQQVTLSPTGALPTAATPPDTTTTNASSPRPAASRSTESRALRVWFGMGVALLSIVVICGVAFAAFWYGSRSWRNSPAPPATASGENAPVASDPAQLASAKLLEADALMASGNTSEAQARLREAAALDPSNAEPQRRLARLLLASGARREAIEALRGVTRLAPTDADAWRSLASAQYAEGLYAEALESYRGLGEASPAALARDTVQLAYADALRQSGRTAEARAIYRRLAASPDAEVASASKQQLGQPTPTATPATDPDEAGAQTGETTARAEATARPPDASASPTTTQPSAPRVESTSATTTPPAPPAKASSGSPSEQYQRGVGLWATNRGAAVAEFRAAAERGNSDASYYLGLSIAEGRDPRALKRAELVAAIVYFGRARRGKFRAQSVAYEEQLGRELDRRRTVPSDR